MPHNLFLLRHAQTHSSQHYNSDKERGLKPEGSKQASEVGKFLNASHFNIDLIISSDATRAKVTALLVAAEIKYPEHKIQLTEKIYSGSTKEILELLVSTPDYITNVLLVGHYPTIVELNNYLSESRKSGMETAELTLLNFETGWAELFEGAGNTKLNYHPSIS